VLIGVEGIAGSGAWICIAVGLEPSSLGFSHRSVSFSAPAWMGINKDAGDSSSAACPQVVVVGSGS
jgi:hypothetical protein